MNIVLFEKDEITKPLPLSDIRGRHIIKILKFGINESFDAGIINGEKGKALITDISENHIYFTFTKDESYESKKHPVILITSFARPPESKKILKNISTIGVKTLCFVRTDKSEKSYTESSLWKKSSYRNYLIDGAVQAFDTDIPDICFFDSLEECVGSSKITCCSEKAALDNYEYTEKLSSMGFEKGTEETAVLAVGGERGWSRRERDVLRESGFTLCSLGERVLKTETACIAGITLIKAGKGII